MITTLSPEVGMLAKISVKFFLDYPLSQPYQINLRMRQNVTEGGEGKEPRRDYMDTHKKHAYTCLSTRCKPGTVNTS